jgi:hypothetical protein
MGEALLPWTSPSFGAYTLGAIALKAMAVNLGEAMGSKLHLYEKHYRPKILVYLQITLQSTKFVRHFGKQNACTSTEHFVFIKYLALFVSFCPLIPNGYPLDTCHVSEEKIPKIFVQ